MGGAENLGLDSVAGIARAEHFSLGSVAAFGIAGLNHEVFDDTVEEQSVVESVADELQEVIAESEV